MRIIHLTPGTGTFHCGSCLRDNALIKALRARRHDAMMVPLYLPLVTDREAANPEVPVQVGGVSLYLQQKYGWFKRVPKFIHRWLDAPGRLRLASKFMGMTAARDLGEMTLGSLVGEKSPQWVEWIKLIDWIKSQRKPDVISLSNSLLTGLAKTLSAELGVPVVCSLQGEDAFLDSLPEPYREQCWEVLCDNAAHVARFIAPSEYYAKVMASRLKVAPDRISVVPNGLDFTPFPTAEPDPNWPVIGYLARMIHGKGLTTVVEAFIDLVKRNRVPRLKLKIGGSKTPVDEDYVAGLQEKLTEAGCLGRVEFHPNMTLDEKVRFLRNLTVFSVPATYGEAFGLYVIEAQASGIPVVEPDSGAFPEILSITDGGILCKPDDPESLADALEEILLDDRRREKLSMQAVTKTRTHFTAANMAERFESMLQGVTGQGD